MERIRDGAEDCSSTLLVYTLIFVIYYGGMGNWSIHHSPVYVEWFLQYGAAPKITPVNRAKSTSRCRIEENTRLSKQWILIFHLTDTQFVLSLFVLVEYNLNQHDQNKYHFRCHLLFSNGVDGRCSLIVFLFFFKPSPHHILSYLVQFNSEPHISDIENKGN